MYVVQGDDRRDAEALSSRFTFIEIYQVHIILGFLSYGMLVIGDMTSLVEEWSPTIVTAGSIAVRPG
jgi:hypothetical protein